MGIETAATGLISLCSSVADEVQAELGETHQVNQNKVGCKNHLEKQRCQWVWGEVQPKKFNRLNLTCKYLFYLF